MSEAHVEITESTSELPELVSYEAALQSIKDAPTTWLGGILACAVHECLRRKFFKDADWLQHFVRRVTEEKPHNGNVPAPTPTAPLFARGEG